MSLAEIVTLAIAAKAPVHGVSIGRADDKSTWFIGFKEEATPEERAAAEAALAAFEPPEEPAP